MKKKLNSHYHPKWAMIYLLHETSYACDACIHNCCYHHIESIQKNVNLTTRVIRNRYFNFLFSGYLPQIGDNTFNFNV